MLTKSVQVSKHLNCSLISVTHNEALFTSVFFCLYFDGVVHVPVGKTLDTSFIIEPHHDKTSNVVPKLV